MDKQGWIKSYRKTQDHWLWQDKPFAYGQAFTQLIMMANHQDGKMLFDKQLIPVKRSEFITSQSKLSVAFGWSRGKVKHFLELLEKDEMIKLNTTSKMTGITIINYDTYQGEQSETEQQDDRSLTTDRQVTNTNKNVKNVKNDKKEKHKLQIYIQENYPTISKMKIQLTYSEAEKLRAEYNANEIKQKLDAMENYVPLLKNNKSVNMTIRNWLRRDANNKKPESETLPPDTLQPSFAKLIEQEYNK